MLAVLPDVLLRGSFELLPAGRRTKVIRLSLIFTFIRCSFPADVHATDRIFEAGFPVEFMPLAMHCFHPVVLR